MMEDTNNFGRVSLGLDIPTNWLHIFEELQDFVFVRVERVLTDSVYAAWCIKEILLENHALLIPSEKDTEAEVLAAMNIIRPCTVVAPDSLMHLEKTVNAARKFTYDNHTNIQIGAIVQGNTIPEMLSCFQQYLEMPISLIVFPNSGPRLEVIQKLHRSSMLQQKSNYALLGFEAFEEIDQISLLGKQWHWSLMTGAPFKIEGTEPKEMDVLTSMKAVRVLRDTLPPPPDDDEIEILDDDMGDEDYDDDDDEDEDDD